MPVTMSTCGGEPFSIAARVRDTTVSRNDAVSVSMRAIFSGSPTTGPPWPGQSAAGALAAISRRPLARSHAKRCTFCGLPSFGTAQMKRSPGHSTRRAGANTQV